MRTLEETRQWIAFRSLKPAAHSCVVITES